MRFTVDQANAGATPLAKLLGIKIVELAPDRVTAALEVRPELCTLPTGLHGGAFMAFADNTAAVATMFNLPEGASGTTTIESKTNFLGSGAVGATLHAIAEPLHKGRRTQVWQTRVLNGERLLAVITQTQLIL